MLPLSHSKPKAPGAAGGLGGPAEDSPGKRERKERLLEGLLNRYSLEEAKLPVKVVVGERRTSFREELLRLALARNFGISEGEMRRASVLSTDTGDWGNPS